MAQLPLIRTLSDVPLLLPRWKSQIDPVLANRLLQGQQIQGLQLGTSPTVVNHSLGVVPQGWVLADQDADAVIYRTVPMTNKTITLQATATCTVNLLVY
jgi:hypothetical protein